MIYELRLYSIAPGRMPDNHERFRRLPPLFERHGIRCVGQWTAKGAPDGPLFIYMMAYADLAEREARWSPFYTDPDWLVLRAKTNAGSEIVERYDLLFLRPNPAWHPAPGDVPNALAAVQELLFYETTPGQAAPIVEYLRNVRLPLLRAHGARIMMVADMVSGPNMPQVLTMLGWRDVAACETGWTRLGQDAEWVRALKQQQVERGAVLLRQTRRHLLDPTPGTLPSMSLGSSIEDSTWSEPGDRAGRL